MNSLSSSHNNTSVFVMIFYSDDYWNMKQYNLSLSPPTLFIQGMDESEKLIGQRSGRIGRRNILYPVHPLLLLVIGRQGICFYGCLWIASLRYFVGVFRWYRKSFLQIKCTSITMNVVLFKYLWSIWFLERKRRHHNGELLSRFREMRTQRHYLWRRW